MLEPYVVLDLTDFRGEIGPMLMGDLGADVIRVEPAGGVAARRAEPCVDHADPSLKSLPFQAFNRNKRSIAIDPGADSELLDRLIGRADFIFSSAPNGPAAALGIDFDRARALNPDVVWIEISPFGQGGPRSEWIANDLVIAAMGGPVALQGVVERAPVRLSVPQVWRHAGVEAAAAAMVAHRNRVRDGDAQFVDLSAQCVMTWTMLNAMDAHAIQGFDFQRCGPTMNNGTIQVQLVHPTRDGYIVALPNSRVLSGLTEALIDEGFADESLRDVDWEDYDLNIPNPGYEGLTLAAATAMLGAYLAAHTKSELFELGLARGISLAPVNTLAELLALSHIEERGYWQGLEVAEGIHVRAPGVWAKTSNSAVRVRRPAPALDADGDQIREEFAGRVERLKSRSTRLAGPLPFSGLKVADFAWVGVGPISGKYLADHGADVVRIESETRPDVLRGGGPFKDGVSGWNRSQFFGDFNTSKKSLALDLKQGDAIDIAKQIITESDVMIESFAPGAVERMGLSYDEVKQLNPGLIMISTCLMGQTGSASSLAGYGYHAGAIAGFYEVTGWPDLGPNGPWIAYTDTIAPRFVSTLLGAAIDYRDRTGEGVYVDLAQIEAALHFLAPEFLDLQVSGYAATRMGNRSRFAAPQGCYPAAGDDRWVAIAIDTDEQFAALCAALERPDLATDFPSHQARSDGHDHLDDLIGAWTQQRSATEVVEHLQQLAVPAGMVQRSSDLLADPQYAERGFYRWFEHTEMGRIPYAGHQYRISGYDNGPRGAAPCLGEHSFEVLSEYLELPDERIAAAYAEGIIN